MSERFAWIYDKAKQKKIWCADMWSRRAILVLQTTVEAQASTIAAQAETIATLQSNYTALEARVAALEGGTTT